MLKVNNAPEKKISADWYSLINELRKPDKLSTFIGITIIMIIAISIVYIGAWKANYASQFYEVKFKINFLEGVQPGIKIRYQGGVIVGEVLNIETNNREHFLNAKIKKDFNIVKSGTKITLKEQGSFGSSYLDISTIPYFFDKEVYHPGDVIQVSEIVPFQETLNNLSKMLESEPNRDSVLSKRLKDIKKMIDQVALNKDLLRGQLGLAIKRSILSLQKTLMDINKFNNNMFNSVESLNQKLNKTANDLRIQIPKLQNNVTKVYTYIHYNPDQYDDKQFMHDEQLYYSVLYKFKLINNLLYEYKEFPYKIIFESGL